MSYRSGFGTVLLSAGCRAVTGPVPRALFIGDIQLQMLYSTQKEEILPAKGSSVLSGITTAILLSPNLGCGYYDLPNNGSVHPVRRFSQTNICCNRLFFRSFQSSSSFFAEEIASSKLETKLAIRCCSSRQGNFMLVFLSFS